MKIRIRKHLNDVDPRIRPLKDHDYDVKYIHSALYNPQKNKGYVIDIKGFEVMVFAYECIVINSNQKELLYMKKEIGEKQ